MKLDDLFSQYAGRLRAFIRRHSEDYCDCPDGDATEGSFNELALELFKLQQAANPSYQRLCQLRGVRAEQLRTWRDIPAMPTSAFKDFEITSLPEDDRPVVFYSSGTTGEGRSRHFHNAESLALYESSLWPWFRRHLLPDSGPTAGAAVAQGPAAYGLVSLTPSRTQAPHSSLVYMFDTVHRHLGGPNSCFCGRVDGTSGTWSLAVEESLAALHRFQEQHRPVLMLGTAFSYVQLLDVMTAKGSFCPLSGGSRVLETGGYKGRSRSLPQSQFRSLLARYLGVPPTDIVGEYGQCELSSQAYERPGPDTSLPGEHSRFWFPPWARVMIVSPESGQAAPEGQPGLVRVFDLANLRSVLAVQTEDLGIARGDAFDLIGRAEQAEPRGCSRMAA